MYRILTTSIAVLLAASSVDAAIDRSKKPEPGPAPEAAFPDYKQVTMSNGLKVFVIEDERTPTVTFRLLIKSGSAFDGDKTGLAGFVAGLLNRGTATRDAATFATEVDSIGAKVEATASPDSIAVVTSGLTKYTDKLIDLFRDAVLNPVFPEEQFTREQRKSLSQLMAERMEPEALATKLTGKVLFGGHPYGAYRTPETVQAITRADLVAFHQKHFLSNNASLAIVGDVKPEQVLPLIEKALGEWKKGEIPTIGEPKTEEVKGLAIHLVDRPGSVQSNIVIAQHGPKRDNPDIAELNVINATLGGGFSGRLFQNLREKHGWTYGAYSAFNPMELAGGFQAGAETRNEVTHLALTEILKEMQRLRTEPVPDPELELQRQYNVGNYLLSLENAARTAQRVQDIDLFGLPADYYKHYAKEMASVTPPMAQDLAKKYLDAENARIVVVGEGKEIRPELEKLGKVSLYDTELKPVPALKPAD
jgi:predicted Zn-dependent peptidase